MSRLIKETNKQGYLLVAADGSLCIDTCPSNDYHLSVDTGGKERRNCRLYLDRVLEKFIGKQIDLYIDEYAEGVDIEMYLSLK